MMSSSIAPTLQAETAHEEKQTSCRLLYCTRVAVTQCTAAGGRVVHPVLLDEPAPTSQLRVARGAGVRAVLPGTLVRVFIAVFVVPGRKCGVCGSFHDLVEIHRDHSCLAGSTHNKRRLKNNLLFE
jgi:hypothetical protein